MKVLLDANIFFAGARSPKGGSGFVLELAKKRKIEVITVSQALLEAEQNIRRKLDIDYLNRHYQNLLEVKPKIQKIEIITLKDIVKLEKIVPRKDVSILLGAILSKSNVLITLDRKHFLENKKLREMILPLEIMNPGEFLRKYFIK